MNQLNFPFEIKQIIQEHGFDNVAVISKNSFPNISDTLHNWLEAGFHGELTWLINNAEKRADARLLWEDVRSAFVVSLNYAPEFDPMPQLSFEHHGYISVYARHLDYHDIMKKRLRDVAKVVENNIQCRVYVDTAPLAEKPMAMRAGIGWQGKHTNLVSREFGSWLFLGVVLTDLEIEQEDFPQKDHCGSCRKCLDVCPTQAFTQPYVLDVRRCISYWTIEYKGFVPPELARLFGNRIYGCDDCLAVCPWNKFAKASHEISFHAREICDMPKLERLLLLDEEAFRSLFQKSPIKRIGYVRFIRNVLIACANSGDMKLLELIERYTHSVHEILQKTASFARQEILSKNEK